MPKVQPPNLRTRRDLLKARGATSDVHIASILVQAWPEKLPGVEADLTRLPGVESHGSAGPGKLVLTIETRSDAELVGRISEIETADGVIAASLVYHQAQETGDDATGCQAPAR